MALRKPITYEDLNGNEQTEIFWFNISRREIIKLNAEHKGGFTQWMQNLIEAEDEKTVHEEFEKILIMSFGIRGDDGKTFDKSDKVKEWFKKHLAYEALYDELTTDANAISEFILGVIPKQAQAETRKAISEATPPAEETVSEATPQNAPSTEGQ